MVTSDGPAATTVWLEWVDNVETCSWFRVAATIICVWSVCVHMLYASDAASSACTTHLPHAIISCWQPRNFLVNTIGLYAAGERVGIYCAT